jgi:hypothetical protein
MAFLIGNGVFAAVVWGYYLYVGGNKARFVSGAVLAFVAFIGGIVTGYIANAPGKKKPVKRGRRSAASGIDTSAFDDIA